MTYGTTTYKMDDLIKAFRSPFGNDEIEWKIQTASYYESTSMYVTVIPYVQAEAIKSRLNKLCGFNWQYRTRLIPGGMIGRLGIRDPETKEWIWRESVGTVNDTEPEKSADSDALKRSARMFNIGSYLVYVGIQKANLRYEKPTGPEANNWNRAYHKQSKTTYWWETPKYLPAWALPKVSIEQATALEEASIGRENDLTAILSSFRVTKVAELDVERFKDAWAVFHKGGNK